MNDKLIDLLVIVGMTLITLALNEFGLLEKYAHFAIIPFLAFYFLGKFVTKKEAKSTK